MGRAGGERGKGTLRRAVFVFAAALLLTVQAPPPAASAASSVLGMRMFDAAGHTRVVFDLSGPVAYKLFSLRRPDRVVLDFKDVAFRAELKNGFRKNRRIVRVRHSERGKDVHRVVFDLNKPARTRTFLLQPHGRRGHRLVLDFGRVRKLAGAARGRVTPVPGESKPKAGRLRDVVVAIDAGHGGKDPGAVGRRKKTREKHVTLAVARQLAAELRKRPGIRPVLTRDGDYYLPLRRRTEIAAKHGADLFVSIHADAFRNPKVRGASAYVLSTRGASSEAARWLAERENAADRAAGGTIDLQGREPMVQSAMVDMSQSGAIRLSTVAASRMLRALKGKVHLHGKHVHRAGFVVLKTRNIPSVLIETAFLSNPDDERLLRDARYRKKLARAIADGIEAYFKRQAPVGTRLAARNRAELASR